MMMTECKDDDDECKILIDESKKTYLKSLNTDQIDLLRHSGESRRRFEKALKDHGLRLIRYLKVIVEDKEENK